MKENPYRIFFIRLSVFVKTIHFTLFFSMEKRKCVTLLYSYVVCYTSVLHFLSNSEGIACWMAELNEALCLVTRARKWKYLIFCPQPVTFTIAPLYHCTTLAFISISGIIFLLPLISTFCNVIHFFSLVNEHNQISNV